mmetsp:Transcript_9592/g.28779  ORF Transcript_9592/g.28779 Transcript_9592/m.28779 type:complete len:447 (-) Transcript_9592:36-1376(-)
MTTSSLISSLFGTASPDQSRLDALRRAEASLISFAGRYDESGGNDQAVEVEVIDTKIPRVSVPLAATVDQCRCSVLPLDTMESDGDVNAFSDDLIIHGVKVTSEKDFARGSPPLVLLHGYANGALYFFRNMLGLTRHHYGTVYCLDLLGWGLSSRPPFNTDDETVASAEAFFVESLEAWRRANGLDKIILGGHSMGGFLSVAYCEKYPERVDNVLLFSPVGVPHESKDSSGRKDMPFTYQLAFGLARYFFEYGLTPSSFIRSLPESSGLVLVEGYVDRRLPFISCPEEKAALVQYLYNNAMLPGSGEDSLNRLLTPMARARRPAIDRIPHLGVAKVSFVYGESDWMDPYGGLEAQKLCAERRRAGIAAPDVDVFGVKNAGHLLLMENWEEFNSAVIMAGGGAAPADSPCPVQFVYHNNKAGNFFKRPSFDQQGQSRNGLKTSRLLE